jgi:hypothetical protein
LAPPYVQTELMGAEQVADPRHAAARFYRRNDPGIGDRAHEVLTERVPSSVTVPAK